MVSTGIPRLVERHESMVSREKRGRGACTSFMKHSRAEFFPPYVGQACQLGFHHACRAQRCACVCHEGRS